MSGLRSKMAPKIFRGILGCRKEAINDVVYINPTHPEEFINRFVIYFGGDIQDYTQSMNESNDGKLYVKWSLENTATKLQSAFPDAYIMVIKPSMMATQTYACYANFVELQNKYGVPKHSQYYRALDQLQSLINHVLEADDQLINLTNLENYELKIIGFSKGCVVLNQFLNEFHYLLKTSDPNSYQILRNFVKHITDMYWLDCGHSGTEDVWVTSSEVLKTLHDLGTKIHVHVSPYQIKDSKRPWIGAEEKMFSSKLQELNANIVRDFHFKNEKPSIINHFRVIDATFQNR